MFDGEVSEEIFTEKLRKFYNSIKNGSSLIVMMYKSYYKKKVDDISPLLKRASYFGVSEEGILQIFKVYGTSAKAEGPVPEVTEKDPQVTILLERMYVDGEVSEEIFTEKVANLEKFYSSIKNGSSLIVMMYKSYYKRKLTIFLRY